MDSAGRIDAVIAWVDGADPLHHEKLLRYCTSNYKAGRTRYADRGEIYYCIASMLKYAPFIGRIWIVTDSQRPAQLEAFARAELCAPDFLQVIDHTELFEGYREFLPTFTARSIEAMLWRLPGLSETFVYLNDDFFLNAPVSPQDWFRDGMPVLRGKKVRPHDRLFRTRARRLLGKLPLVRARSVRPTYHQAQELGANRAGVAGKFMLADHHPHPMRRSVQAAFFANHPAVLQTQLSFKFRDIGQYSPVSLANHLEIALNGVNFDAGPEVLLVRPESRKLARRLEAGIRGEAIPFGCIQNLDQFDPQMLKLVRTLMREKLGDFLPDEIQFKDEELEPMSVGEQGHLPIGAKRHATLKLPTDQIGRPTLPKHRVTSVHG